MACRSRGTPRIANRLLRRVRDFAQVRADGRITREVAMQALTMFEVDEKGFDQMDRTILLTVIDKFDGGPVGIDNLSAAIGEETDDDRGCLRTLSHPGRVSPAHAAGTDRDPAGRTSTSAGNGSPATRRNSSDLQVPSFGL